MLHQDLSELHLLLNKVGRPGPDALVVDGQALRRGIVEEGNLVGDIHTHWISNKGLAGLDLL